MAGSDPRDPFEDKSSVPVMPTSVLSAAPDEAAVEDGWESKIGRTEFNHLMATHEAFLKSGNPESRLNVAGATVEGIQATELDMSGAVFTAATLRYCTFWRSKFDEAIFDRATLRGAVFENSSFVDAKMRGAILRGASFKGANMTGVDLSPNRYGGGNQPSDLVGARLSEVNLSGAKMADADLERADLKDANLDNSDMRHCNLFEANFAGATLKGCQSCKRQSGRSQFRRCRSYRRGSERGHLAERETGEHDSGWCQSQRNRSEPGGRASGSGHAGGYRPACRMGDV